MSHDDNSTVGRVYEHPKAAIDRPGYVRGAGPTTRFAQPIFIAAFSGLIGAVTGSFWGFGFAGFIGGAMTGFALRTAWVLFATPPPDDEYSNGNSRTEEEVRAALAELKARDR